MTDQPPLDPTCAAIDAMPRLGLAIDVTDERARAERKRHTDRVVAIADIYVITNKINALIEDRASAVDRAKDAGATTDELLEALGIITYTEEGA